MTMYKAGDIVRVREFPANAPGIFFVPDMHKYCGISVTITSAYLNEYNRSRYDIQEDHKYVWCDEFFELIDTSKESYEYW